MKNCLKVFSFSIAIFTASTNTYAGMSLERSLHGDHFSETSTVQTHDEESTQFRSDFKLNDEQIDALILLVENMKNCSPPNGPDLLIKSCVQNYLNMGTSILNAFLPAETYLVTKLNSILHCPLDRRHGTWHYYNSKCIQSIVDDAANQLKFLKH